MKTEAQIQRRLRQRHFRYRKKVLEGSLRRAYRNCTHNVEAETSYGGVACVCVHPDLTQDGSYDVEVGRLVVANRVPRFPSCDDEQDQAPSCPHFEPRHSKELLEQRYSQLMDELSTDPEKFAEGFPDMAQLAWALELTGAGDSSPDLMPPDAGEEVAEERGPLLSAGDRVTDAPAVEGEDPAANSAKAASSSNTPVTEPEVEIKDIAVKTAAPEGTVTITGPANTVHIDISSSWWRRLVGWILRRMM